MQEIEDSIEAFILMVFLALHAYIHYLQDIMVGTEFQVPHIDLDIVMQEVFSQLAHLLWPSSTPH